MSMGGGTPTETRRVAVVFPGQGTQRPGMGVPWQGHRAWEIVEAAEAATGESLGRLLTDATPDELSRTREAQLAVFLTSLVAWEAAREHLPTPVAFAGHSLGQLTALVAAGVLPVDQGARLVLARAEATQAAADATPGRMVALLGAALDLAEEACAVAPGACWVANDNAPGQVVIGGTPEGTAEAADAARKLGVKKVIPLDVGGAFHTPLMEAAREEFSATLAGLDFDRPRVPVVANTDAEPHADTAWAARLADHLVRRVRWRESSERFAGLGVELVVEVGHGSMLAGLIRRTARGLPVAGVATPNDLPVGVTAS